MKHAVIICGRPILCCFYVFLFRDGAICFCKEGGGLSSDKKAGWGKGAMRLEQPKYGQTMQIKVESLCLKDTFTI